MDAILRLRHTKTGRIILSVLWGFALAAIFKFTCEGRDCIVFKAPDAQEITQNTYHHNKNCYTFTTETVPCKGDTIGI